MYQMADILGNLFGFYKHNYSLNVCVNHMQIIYILLKILLVNSKPSVKPPKYTHFQSLTRHSMWLLCIQNFFHLQLTFLFAFLLLTSWLLFNLRKFSKSRRKKRTCTQIIWYKNNVRKITTHSAFQVNYQLNLVLITFRFQKPASETHQHSYA